jgi:hypothetical protein
MWMRTLWARLISVGLALFVSGLALARDRQAESRWTASPLKVDGLNDEWLKDSLYTEKRLGVGYAFKNDARDLYILFVFENPRSIDAVEATGMAVYFRSGGDEKKGGGFRFVQEFIPVDQFIALLENQGRSLTDEDKGFLRTRYQYPVFEAYAIDGKGRPAPRSGQVAEGEQPAFSAAKTEKGMIYEFRIPLASCSPRPGGPGATHGQSIRIGFEWGGSSRKVLKAKASWQSPESLVSGDVNTGWGETRAQEFLSSFDGMSRPSLETKAYSFWADVSVAPPR